MKQIKLEVGKTYRSRKGEEVKIVRKDDYQSKYPYRGRDSKWYTENGRFDLDVEESMYDLIEEVPETRHTFVIPDGVKEVTVEQVGNKIVVEMVPTAAPKPGDVMVNKYKGVYIFKSDRDDGEFHNHFARIGDSGKLSIAEWCIPGRPATPEEAKPLWDALKKAGKKWNAETMEVEDVTERERIMEYLQDYVNNTTWSYGELCSLIEGYLKYREGEK